MTKSLRAVMEKNSFHSEPDILEALARLGWFPVYYLASTTPFQALFGVFAGGWEADPVTFGAGQPKNATISA